MKKIAVMLCYATLAGGQTSDGIPDARAEADSGIVLLMPGSVPGEGENPARSTDAIKEHPNVQDASERAGAALETDYLRMTETPRTYPEDIYKERSRRMESAGLELHERIIRK